MSDYLGSTDQIGNQCTNYKYNPGEPSINSNQITDINNKIYYHPTIFSKVLSGILWFIGLTFIYSGIRSFSLLSSEYISTLRFVLISFATIICGILFYLLGILLYTKKPRVHLGFSFILSIITCILAIRLLDFSYGVLDKDIILNIGIGIVAFFFLINIIRIIRYIIFKKLNKKGQYIPDLQNNKKRIGIIVLIILIFLLIANLIYGKLQYNEIPEIEESLFIRTDHQINIPQEKDALVQLQNYNRQDSIITSNTTTSLDMIRSEIFVKADNNTGYLGDSRKQHPNECILIYSGNESFCGTRARNNDTLERLLNRPSNRIPEKYFTIMEYLDDNEPKIRLEFQKLNHILSMDYYIPQDEYLDLLPQYLNSFARGSAIALAYYIQKGNRNMVFYIIQENYKLISIIDDIGGSIYGLNSIVNQGIIDETLNQSMNMLPAELRMRLLDFYETVTPNRDIFFAQIAKGEYSMQKELTHEILIDKKKHLPFITFMQHFPFASAEDSKRALLYIDNLLYYDKYNEYYNFLDHNINSRDSIYNTYHGKILIASLAPRLQSIDTKLNKNIFQKNALINNLKSGEYISWFSENSWTDQSDWDKRKL